MPADPPPRPPAPTARPAACGPAACGPAAGEAVRRFLRSEDGPTSVEYAMMLALILATVFGTVASVGGSAAGMFTTTQTELNDAGF